MKKILTDIKFQFINTEKKLLKKIFQLRFLCKDELMFAVFQNLFFLFLLLLLKKDSKAVLMKFLMKSVPPTKKG
jgi:hypothetical protein